MDGDRPPTELAWTDPAAAVTKTVNAEVSTNRHANFRSRVPVPLHFVGRGIGYVSGRPMLEY